MPEGTVRRPLDSYAPASRCTRPAARNAEIGRLHDLVRTCELKNRVAHHVYTKAALARLRSGSTRSAGDRNRHDLIARIDHLMPMIARRSRSMNTRITRSSHPPPLAAFVKQLERKKEYCSDERDLPQSQG